MQPGTVAWAGLGLEKNSPIGLFLRTPLSLLSVLFYVNEREAVSCITYCQKC